MIFYFEISTRIAILLVLAIAGVTVLDTTIIGFIAYSNIELPTNTYLLIFVTLFAIYSLCELTLFYASQQKTSTIADIRHRMVAWLPRIMAGTQYTIIGILLSIVFQMFLFNSYHILFIEAIVYAANIPAIIIMIYLVAILINWFRSNRSLMILSYAATLCILCLYLFVSILYLPLQMSHQVQLRIPYSIHFSLASAQAAYLQLSFGPILDTLSLTSFLGAWLATAALLRQYRQRLGKLKYWALITTPLVYFLFPFGTYFIDLSQELMADSPVLFSIIYVATFSATKQVGGILFSMVFLTAAAIVNRNELRRQLVYSAVGISVIFGSMDSNSILYAIYPPFGVITISFMPIGAFLLFKGIYGSARQISQDTELRRNLHRSVETQLSLLRTIGATQMEEELLKKFKPVYQKTKELEPSTNENLEQEDVRLLIRDVLNEIESRRELKLKDENK